MLYVLLKQRQFDNVIQFDNYELIFFVVTREREHIFDNHQLDTVNNLN